MQHLAGDDVGGFGVALRVGDHAVHLVVRLLGAGVRPKLNGDRGCLAAIRIRNLPVEVLDGFGVDVSKPDEIMSFETDNGINYIN